MGTVIIAKGRSLVAEAERKFNNAIGRIQTFEGTEIDHKAGDDAAKWWLYSAILWFPFLATFGLILAIKFVFPNFIGNENWFTFGEVRPAHVNGVTFGFISTGLIGAMYFVVPRLCATRLFSPALVKLGAVLWNGALIAGIVAILFGASQSREYAELPFASDVVVVIAAIIIAITVIATIVKRREKKLYVALWYYMATVLWFPVFYFIGNVMWQPPVGALNGVQDSFLNWYYGHNVFGIWVTTLGTALWYYMIPVITRRAVDSHATALIGFFGIAWFYTGIGAHHLIQAPIPEWLKTLTIGFSALMLIPVAAFASNIIMTMRGAWRHLNGFPIFQIIIFAFFSYIIVSTQGTLQALRSVNTYEHFTQWVVAHSHLGLLAGFGFLAMGAIYWIIPKITGYRIFSFSITRYSWWIGFIGFIMFFASMTILGIQQGSNWWYHINVIETLPALRPLFFARAITGGLVVVAAFIFAFNMVMTLILRRPAVADDPHEGEMIHYTPPDEYSEAQHKIRPKSQPIYTRIATSLNMPVVLAGSLTIFGIMTFMVTFVPYMFSPNTPSISAVPLTAQEQQGMDLYRSMGCVYCHSQFNRPMDWAMGEYSQNGDWYYNSPQFLGTERTGPTLARIAGKRPTQWLLSHFVDPRSFDPRSIMPTFGWLGQDKLAALTSYVETIGRRDLDPNAFQPLIPLEYRGQSNIFGPMLATVSQGYDPKSQNYSGPLNEGTQFGTIFEQGKLLFTQKCLPCHGGSGNGQGPYARQAVARPANIHERMINYPIPQDTFAFWRVSEGVPGTLMPPWGWSMDEGTRWKIITYEESFAYGAVRTVPQSLSQGEAVQYGLEFSKTALIPGTQQDYVTGQALYNLYCAQCHGTGGTGNGPASVLSGGYINPVPFNLVATATSANTLGEIMWWINQGVETTNMPPWKEALNDTDRYQIAYYIQSFAPADIFNAKWAPIYSDAFAKNLKK